ncbi:MAG: ATP-dependent Clp protease adaptor ClpS [Candidatus Hydrogenedentales bacterium]
MTKPAFNTVRGERVKPCPGMRLPRRFKVLLHNDGCTTWQFVVQVLMAVFRMQHAEAVRIMLHIKEHGEGVCGIYPAQIAETIVERVHELADSQGYPLLCTMEEE